MYWSTISALRLSSLLGTRNLLEIVYPFFVLPLNVLHRFLQTCCQTIQSEYPSFMYALVHHNKPIRSRRISIQRNCWMLLVLNTLAFLIDINIKAFQQNCSSAVLFKIKWIFSLWNRIEHTVDCPKIGWSHSFHLSKMLNIKIQAAFKSLITIAI